jgi:hypothetical protein
MSIATSNHQLPTVTISVKIIISDTNNGDGGKAKSTRVPTMTPIAPTRLIFI